MRRRNAYTDCGVALLRGAVPHWLTARRGVGDGYCSGVGGGYGSGVGVGDGFGYGCYGGGGGPDPQFARWAMLMDDPLDFKQMVVWDKGPMGMGWQYRRSYETVLVGQKRGAACKWHDQSGRIENIIRPGKVNKIIPGKEQHPTPKPPELSEFFMLLHSQRGETVLDPFMGGGSTAIGAHRLDRRFIGVEIEERWFDMAYARLRTATTEPLFDRIHKPAGMEAT